MQAATLSHIRKELATTDADQLAEIILRLAKFKKDNKELLSYLLFMAQDEAAYVKDCKLEIEDQFDTINDSHIYYAKKGIRKSLRITNQLIKYSAEKTTEIELLICFCQHMKELSLDYTRSTAMTNLYERVLKRLDRAIGTLHEDLQYDYRVEVDELSN